MIRIFGYQSFVADLHVGGLDYKIEQTNFYVPYNSFGTEIKGGFLYVFRFVIIFKEEFCKNIQRVCGNLEKLPEFQKAHA